MLTSVSKFGLFLIRFLIFLSTRENIYPRSTCENPPGTRDNLPVTCDNLRATAKIRLFTPTDAILSVW